MSAEGSASLGSNPLGVRCRFIEHAASGAGILSDMVVRILRQPLRVIVPVFAVAAPASAAAPLNYLTSHGVKADATLGLTWGVTAISIIVVIIIAGLLALSIWRRPGLSVVPGEKVPITGPEGGLNWLWIGVGLSSLALLGTVIWTVEVLAEVADSPSTPPFTIEITGHQWWWQVRYLSDDPSRVFNTANEVHIPVGRPVRFRLVGGDVIHSFWVPALSGKTDVIPGQTNELWLEARDAGTYQGQCTEYCGMQHAHMAFLVIADPPSQFEAWWTTQLHSPAQNGSSSAAMAFKVKCGSCHAVRGTDAAGILGPDLSHFAERRTIAAGLLPNTPDNLARWVSDPQALKPGSMMQRPEISQQELAAIDGYLRSLR
jgi:cytochrome c oxidase subunit 2